jgi:uncharacterized protein
MKRLVLAVLPLGLLLAAPLAAQPPEPDNAEARRQDIRKLLELTGSAEVGIQVMSQMVETFKQTAPGVPEEFWTELMKEVDPESMIALIVPIYEKHLTHEDVRGLIAFYETPLGRKVTDVLPAIAQESMEAGQRWGLEIAQKVQTKLEAWEKQKGPKG